MLIESAKANIYEPPSPLPAKIDWLDLTWLQCRRRAGKQRTRSGREVSILLRLKHVLRHGDVLGHWPDGSVVIVNVHPTAVLIASPREPSQGMELAFELGNLHIPIEI